MLWFYLQPFFGNHTQKRETETELKHMPLEAYPRRSDCHPRPFHVMMSALFLFLPFCCLCKPILGPTHPRRKSLPSSSSNAQNPENPFLKPICLTRFGCIPPHPSLKPKKPISQIHSDKPILQTHFSNRSISLSLNLSLFLPPLTKFVNKKCFYFDFWLC